MAKMTKCGDCGQQVSKSAKRCPNCGKKLTPRSVWIFGGMFAFIVLWLVVGGSNDETKTTQEIPVATTSNNQATNEHEEHKAERLAEIEADPNYKRTKPMDYSVCLDLQKVYSDGMQGVKSVHIKNESKLSVIKYCATDGATTVTCDGTKNTMTIAKSDSNGC